ncbi:MAG TPA: response regulator transcription factor [Polyangia bacterium]|nr:response regulator transcription factor [Polyangia bacterium]
MHIAIADSSKVFRMGLRALVADARDMTIVAESGDGAGVLAAAQAGGVDVVVCDFDLPDRSAILLANALREIAPATRLLVLAEAASESQVRQALLAGVTGYVLKRQPTEEILAAIREVKAGRRVMPARSDDATSSDLPRSSVGRAGALDRLSAREREIFDLIIWGQTNKQVAVKLGISVKTVETHRSHINGKLQVHSAAELVRLASLCGVLTSPPVEGALRPSNGAGHVDSGAPMLAKTG